MLLCYIFCAKIVDWKRGNGEMEEKNEFFGKSCGKFVDSKNSRTFCNAFGNKRV